MIQQTELVNHPGYIRNMLISSLFIQLNAKSKNDLSITNILTYKIVL